MSGRAEPARLDHSGSHPLTGRRLVVMARWPAPGRCKRRLAVVLGDQRAARVQQRLTAHDLEVARIACAASAAELVLATKIGRAHV